jgi:hypothetical protein
MTGRAPAKILAPAHQEALARAVERLEFEGLASKISAYAGQPMQKALSFLPGPAAAVLNGAVEKAVLKGLNLAIVSLDPDDRKTPMPRLTAVFTGFAGGLSGLAGFAGLPVELPVTTLLMLRSIASIARHMGEDLSTPEARLACVSVFAFGGGARDKSEAEVGYYASRALLGKLASNVSAAMAERGLATAAAPATAPAVAAFAGEVTTRFSATVWERAAASAVPLIGAIGGASLNVIFTNHFNGIAWSHFTIRRLERIYGEDFIRENYARLNRERRLSSNNGKS